MDQLSENSVLFFCSHIHIERKKIANKSSKVWRALPFLMQNKFASSKQKILLWWLHCSWDLRTPEPRRERVITTQISIACNRVTAASRAVCKGALAANCPSAIRDLNSFLCSCGDLINKICKLIIIKKIITCQKDLIIWHSKLQACQWINLMTKQIWSSWLPLSRSLHQSLLSP